MTSKSYPTKSFEQEHNIALIKQSYTKDVLELTHKNWAYLYEEMKMRGLNAKEIKNNMTKYDRDVISLIESSHFFYFDKVTFSRMSMKQKLTQYNNRLRIRLSELFEFIAMLHLQDLSSTVEFMYSSLIGIIESMVDSVEGLKQSNYRLQKELEDWKLKKKNVLCFSCRKNVEEAKLRDLAGEISLTVSEQVPTELIDQQHRVKKIEFQCRNLQMELNAMSEEHFFNSESDHLIDLINQVLKTRMNLSDKTERKQNTITVLSKCLSDVSEMAKPLQMDYTPLQSGQELQTTKKLGIAFSSRVLSLKELGDSEQYVNKMKVLFAEPLHRFIEKYQGIIEAKYKSVPAKPAVEVMDQETQTSLIKQPEYVKNLEKQLNSMTKQLASIKVSKQNNEKEVMRVLELLQKNEGKMIEIISKNRLVEIENGELNAANDSLKKKIKALEKENEAERENLFKKFAQEKASLLQQVSALEEEIKQLRQENIQRDMRHRLESRGIQTFTTAFRSERDLCQAETQTEEMEFTSHFIKSSKKNILKTLKSNRLKSNSPNDIDENYSPSNVVSSGNVFEAKKHHLKSRSDIPVIFEQNSQTSRLGINEERIKAVGSRENLKMMKNNVIGQNFYARELEGFQAFEGSLNRQDERESMMRMCMKKNRKPSINCMIAESSENSRNYLVSNRFFVSKDSEFQGNESDERQGNAFSYGYQQNGRVQGQTVSRSSASRFHRSQQSQLSLNEKKRVKKSDISEEFNFDENTVVLQNFDDISNILSSTGREGLYASKLKKMPKKDIKELMGREMHSRKKTVVINGVEGLNDNNKENDCSGDVNSENCEVEMQAGENDKIFTRNLKTDNKRKEWVKLIIEEKFDHLDDIGVIQLIEQVQETSHEVGYENQQRQLSSTCPQAFRKLQFTADKTHITKSDLELFFSLQQASKFEHRSGLWSQLQSCIMVDNNFSKLTDEVDRYFQHLKASNKPAYNEYLLFLQRPMKFMKEVVDERSKSSQKQKVVREFARLEKVNCGGGKKDVLREIFRKLVRLHKAVHKNGCRHVERFLEKIGFYGWKEKELSQRAQTPSNVKGNLRQSMSTSKRVRNVKS